MKYSDKIQKTVIAGIFAALVFAGTWIHVPTPEGNVNLGDAVILIAAWNLGGVWSVLAASAGAALADLSGAFALWAPGTAVIKALTVLTVLAVKHVLKNKKESTALPVSAICGELCMVAGYFLYEYFFLSLGASSVANIPLNLLQGLAATLVALFVNRHLPKRFFGGQNSTKRK